MLKITDRFSSLSSKARESVAKTAIHKKLANNCIFDEIFDQKLLKVLNLNWSQTDLILNFDAIYIPYEALITRIRGIFCHLFWTTLLWISWNTFLSLKSRIKVKVQNLCQTINDSTGTEFCLSAENTSPSHSLILISVFPLILWLK